jgi:hypothetical protein
MPIQQWRCPVALQAKSAAAAGIGIVVAFVFLAPALAILVMAVLGVWGLSMCVRRGTVLLDPDGDRIVVRYGLITRRIRLSRITAVQVDRAKVTIGTADGNVISFYAWQRSRLDRWLRGQVVASEVGHAIARAATTVQEAAAAQDAAAPQPVPPRPRQQLAMALLACAGAVEFGAAFGVRLSWSNPVMTALAVILVLGLGVAGALSIVVALWMLLRSRWPQRGASAA